MHHPLSIWPANVTAQLYISVVLPLPQNLQSHPNLTAVPPPLLPLSTCTSPNPPAPLNPSHPHQAEPKSRPVSGSESNLVSWLDAANKTSAVVQQHNTAVAGELVGVDVQISNPMALGLSLTQLRAVYEHESGATGPVNEYLKVLPLHP